MDFANENFLDSLLTFFETHSVTGLLELQPYAWQLVCVLAIIDFCSIWALYDGEMRMSLVISKVIKVGFFLFLVINWSDINKAILDSFQMAGSTAAQLDYSTGSWNTPSHILTMGFDVCQKILEDFHETSLMAEGGIARCFMDLIAMIITIAAFFFISLQVLITKIEFCIFSSLGVILLPFGSLRYTSFLFQRVVSGVFAFGVKLMVMFFLLGLFQALAGDLTEIPVPGKTEDGNFALMLKVALSYATLAFLVWKIPNIASSMMNGQPSMNAGDVIGGVRSAKGTTMAAGAAIGGVAGAIAGGANKVASTAGYTNATIKAAQASVGTSGRSIAGEAAKNVMRERFANSNICRSLLRGASRAKRGQQTYENIVSGNYAKAPRPKSDDNNPKNG